MSLSQNILNYIDTHKDETIALLKEIAQIPAPSHKEEKRVAFCLDWLKKNGVEAYEDSARNVIIPFGKCEAGQSVKAFLAHSDVVFPDMETLPLWEQGDELHCPGVGDNTMHVTHVLMAARYITEEKLQPQEGGVMLVINSGEEGLGNLFGCRQFVADHADKLTEFWSLDSKDGKVCNETVGSLRYRVEVLTEGGHSFSAFGNRNAIVYLASLIDSLYQMKVPSAGISTYNVGCISGGTSVNTIAQQAEMLFEMRSTNRESLAEMDRHFKAAIDYYRSKGIGVNVELAGERPCMGDVDREKLQAMAEKAMESIRTYFDLEPRLTSASTDCNIPTSYGIPSVNAGCYIGFGTHTREEYVLISSIIPSQKVTFDLILDHFKTENV